jgi:hypothetical protein
MSARDAAERTRTSVGDGPVGYRVQECAGESGGRIAGHEAQLSAQLSRLRCRVAEDHAADPGAVEGCQAACAQVQPGACSRSVMSAAEVFGWPTSARSAAR